MEGYEHHGPQEEDPNAEVGSPMLFGHTLFVSGLTASTAKARLLPEARSLRAYVPNESIL